MTYANTSQCLLILFRCSTDHKRSYNVKSNLKVKGHNFTPEKSQIDRSKET